MDRYYVGIDIGGTSAKLCMYRVGDDVEEVVSKWSIPTNKRDSSGVLLDNLVAAIAKECERLDVDDRMLAGIGIGIPGPVTADGTVLECVNLNFGIVNLKDEMRMRTGIDNIVIGNDANVAALGEMWKGGAVGYKNVIMVTLGTGVGGGIIIDGRIHVGSVGAAAEIGHMTVNADEEEPCGCGCYGCIEQYASATGIVRLAVKELEGSDVPSALRGIEVTAKTVFDEAKNGDELALKVVGIFARYLGITLANVASVIDPEVFLIGGGVSAAGDIITETVRKYYVPYAMKPFKDKMIRLATLGNDAGVYGCIKMVIDNMN